MSQLHILYIRNIISSVQQNRSFIYVTSPPPLSYFNGQPSSLREPVTETSQSELVKSRRSLRKTTFKKKLQSSQCSSTRPSPLFLLPVRQRVQVVTSRKEVMFVLSTYSVCVYVHVGQLEERGGRMCV